MRVYIVECGECYEGGTILGVFESKEAAIKRALAEPTALGGEWKIRTEGACVWFNSCDFVQVTEHQVNDESA